MTKKIKFLFFLLSAGILLASFVFAQKPLEVTYPSIPLADTPTTVKTSLPAYLKYAFNFSLVTAGILIFLAILKGGFSYLTSAANPEGLKDSKDQIISAVIGTILLLSSYIILNTLNPTLTVLQMPGARIVKEIHVWNDLVEEKDAVRVKISEADLTLDLGSGGARHLKLNATNFDEVDVIVYSEVNYNKDRNGSEATITAAGNLPFAAKSISLAWKIPGVYLHSGINLGGEPRLYLFNQGVLPDFNDKAQSIRLLNKDSNRFAAVLHRDQNFQGGCAVIFNDQNSLANEDTTSGGGIVGNEQASSVTVLRPDFARAPSGEDGVTLFGKDSSRNKAWASFTNRRVGTFPVSGFKDGSNDTVNIKDDSINEIQIIGNYIAILFQASHFGGKCEVFTKSDDNLADNPIGKCPVPFFECFCIPILGWCSSCYGPCTSSFIVVPTR